MKINFDEIEDIDEEEINEADICEVCGNELALNSMSKILSGKEERFCCTKYAGVFRSNL